MDKFGVIIYYRFRSCISIGLAAELSFTSPREGKTD